jgi:deoxyhypusine synthase
MVLHEYDYNKCFDLSEILDYQKQGDSQLGNLSEAIQLLKEIQEIRAKDQNAKLILSYTSNMISSGMREVI